MKKWFAAAALGVLALSMAASAEFSITGKDSASLSVSGDVQYRFQYDYITVSSMDGKSKAFSSGDYLNKYAWDLFVKANPNKNILIGLRLSNPYGYNLDQIPGNLSHFSGNPAPVTGLSVAEMYLKWTVGIFGLTAGIIPVMGNTVLDLSLFENNDYTSGGFALPGYYPWAVGMNNSLKAAEINFAFMNTPDLGLGLDVIAAVDSDFTPPKYAGVTVNNSTGIVNELKQDQFRLAGSIPITLMNKMITISPEWNWHTNILHSADLSKEDHIFTGGGDINVKPMKDFVAKAGFAAGGYRNNALEDNAGYVEHAPLGLLTNLGAYYTYLPATTAMVDFSYGSSIDRQATNKYWENLYYWDVKNPFPVLKLILIPRIRIWYWTDSKDSQSKVQVRPELNVRATF